MENELLENLGRLHTTELGVIRIKKNLSLNVENVIEWCKEKISLSNAEITSMGLIPSCCPVRTILSSTMRLRPLLDLR